MSEVEVAELSVWDAVAEMADCGISEKNAHKRMRSAMKAFSCSHVWQPEGEFAHLCKKCRCRHIHDIKGYFGIKGDGGEE
ncbi:hypothetical protein ACIUXL_24200 [Pseudomonas aeruginosa]